MLVELVFEVRLVRMVRLDHLLVLGHLNWVLQSQDPPDWAHRNLELLSQDRQDLDQASHRGLDQLGRLEMGQMDLILVHVDQCKGIR